MSEERLKILEMLQNGTISAAEAAALLRGEAAPDPSHAAPHQPDAPPKATIPDPEPPSTPTQRLHIRVTDKRTDSTRVNITIPLGLLRFGLQIGERFAPELKGWELESFRIDVDEEDEQVRIFVA
jgi:hypothetical protein